MRIGFNCLHVIPGHLGGLETFIHSLLEDVSKVPASIELIIFCSAQYKSVFDKYQPRFQVVDFDVNVNSASRRIRFEQFRLPQQLVNHRIDILHSSGYTAPITKCCKTVMSVHDLNYIEIPRVIRRSHGTIRWAALRLLGPMAMKKADKILTISNHVRHQITRHFGIEPSRIATIYARSPGDFSKMASQPPALPADFERDFLLYVGSWLPHKNHKALFEALAEARRRKIELPRLVLAGLHMRSEAARSELRAALQQLEIQDRVHCIDQHLKLEHLAYLYQRAQVFVFPSTFEGFGIPVIEAMSARLPVICSDVQPVKEVAGDGAILFSPTNPLELLDHLTDVCANRDRQLQLAERGYRRFLELQQESQLASDKLLKIYQSLINS